MSLANMSDGETALQEAEKLIQLMAGLDHIEPSVAVYNSFITVCNKQLFGKAQLLDKALDILSKMNEMSQSDDRLAPNQVTLSLVMKACSLSQHDDHEKVMANMSKIFSQLEEQEPSEKSALALTDRAYFYMMKCVDNCVIGDQAAKK